jgi:hypothetical protein
MKTCRHCGRDKPLSEFPAHKRTLDRLPSWCKQCHNEATRQWRERKKAQGALRITGRDLAKPPRYSPARARSDGRHTSEGAA